MCIHGKVIAPYHQAKWIIMSSFGFIGTAVYALFKNYYGYGCLSACIGICSINHWRNPRYGLIRNIDITVAYTSAVLYIINGFLYVKVPIIKYTGIPMVSVILYAYKFSDNIHKQYPDKSYWVKYHVLFHLIAVFQIFIITYFNNKNKTNEITI